MKVLLVCLGNICRSPMAEGILRKKAKDNGIAIETDSCGTAAYHEGEPPDTRAQETISKHNNDISDLRGRKFKIEDFDRFDLIYAMDEDNYKRIIALARNQSDIDKVDMIMNVVYPGENISVPDPYYGGLGGFERTYEMLDLAAEKFIEGLSRKKTS